MKTNWKIALMCMATLALVACKDSKKSDEPTPEPTPDPTYVSPISVNDGSVADWDDLDAKYVAVAVAPESPVWDGVRMIKVYADKVYINWMLVFDPDKYVKHRDVDVMHIFMDVDHSEATGGYFDLFQDACADLMFEGSLFNETGSINYSPAVYEWTGPVNGEEWDNWTLVNPSIKGQSQLVGNNIIEARIMRDYIPGKEKFAAEGFGFGATLTQNFEPAAVGFLPQGNSPDGELIGRSNMLFVPFAK